jgi:hypothetical protein
VKPTVTKGSLEASVERVDALVDKILELVEPTVWMVKETIDQSLYMDGI